MTQKPSSGYLPEKFENTYSEIYAPLCSVRHYSQWPRHENNQSPLMVDWKEKT